MGHSDGKNHVTIYSKLDEIGTLSKYINKLKDEMRDEKRNREEADTDYQNAVRKLEKGESHCPEYHPIFRKDRSFFILLKSYVMYKRPSSFLRCI